LLNKKIGAEKPFLFMSQFRFNNAAQALGAQTKQAAIRIMRETKQYFGKAFDKEQLGNDKWAQVARKTPGNYFNLNRKVRVVNKPTGKTIFVDQGKDWDKRKINKGVTGRLRYKTIRADSSITGNGAVSTMTNPVPYAEYVNDGTAYQPARPFMKHTDELTTIQLHILEQETGQIWKKV